MQVWTIVSGKTTVIGLGEPLQELGAALLTYPQGSMLPAPSLHKRTRDLGAWVYPTLCLDAGRLRGEYQEDIGMTFGGGSFFGHGLKRRGDRFRSL